MHPEPAHGPATSARGPLPIGRPGPGGPTLALLRDVDPVMLRARARAWGAHRGEGVLSRSYAGPYALVAWHADRVGVDIEQVSACDERFAASICTPEETAQGAAAGDDAAIISLWSGKEALAKALGDALGYDPRRLPSPSGWTGGTNGPWRARRLRLVPGYCAWVCWRRSTPPPPTLSRPCQES